MYNFFLLFCRASTLQKLKEKYANDPEKVKILNSSCCLVCSDCLAMSNNHNKNGDAQKEEKKRKETVDISEKEPKKGEIKKKRKRRKKEDVAVDGTLESKVKHREKKERDLESLVKKAKASAQQLEHAMNKKKVLDDGKKESEEDKSKKKLEIITGWSISKVEEFFQSLGVEDTSCFQEELVDGEALLMLSKEDLKSMRLPFSAILKFQSFLKQ